jgi:hypothetical protein
VYEAMRKDEAALLAMLRDYELKLVRTTHRSVLGAGIEKAVEVILGELDVCAADFGTNGRWARQIETARQHLISGNGIPQHLRANILHVGP